MDLLAGGGRELDRFSSVEVRVDSVERIYPYLIHDNDNDNDNAKIMTMTMPVEGAHHINADRIFILADLRHLKRAGC